MDAWRAILHRAKNFDEQGRYYSSCITRRVGLPAETSQSSATAIPLEGAVVSAARQQVTHILDCFHMSMRVRHIEHAFEGILQFEPELKSWLLTSAYCDVPRLRHLLCSGYVDETRDALRLMSYWVGSAVSEYTHEINAKMKRFLVIIDELATYLRLSQLP